MRRARRVLQYMRISLDTGEGTAQPGETAGSAALHDMTASPGYGRPPNENQYSGRFEARPSGLSIPNGSGGELRDVTGGAVSIRVFPAADEVASSAPRSRDGPSPVVID